MAIHTSRIFYGRGVPKTHTNFAFVAQTNNTIQVPVSKYLKSYNFYNRNNINKNATGFRLLPWSN